MAEIKAAAAKANALQSGLFSRMTEAEITACVAKSVILSCKPGDRVIKQGNVAKNMGMVLSGGLDVRESDRTVAHIAPGEVYGEIAFFLKTPRTMDLISCAEDTCVISFNERTLRQLMTSDGESAAKLLFNISSILCQRVAHMNLRA